MLRRLVTNRWLVTRSHSSSTSRQKAVSIRKSTNQRNLRRLFGLSAYGKLWKSPHTLSSRIFPPPDTDTVPSMDPDSKTTRFRPFYQRRRPLNPFKNQKMEINPPSSGQISPLESIPISGKRSRSILLPELAPSSLPQSANIFHGKPFVPAHQ